MVFFIAGILIGAAGAWALTHETRSALRELRSQNAELVRARGLELWEHRTILDDLDHIAPTRGITSNQ